MGLGNYEGPAEIYADGRLLAEVTSMTFRVISNNQPVRTMIKGLAGKSDGPRETEATIETAVPVTGYELNFYALLGSGKIIRLVFVDGGKRHTAEGWIDTVDSTRGTDAAASSSIAFKGGAPRSR